MYFQWLCCQKFRTNPTIEFLWVWILHINHKNWNWRAANSTDEKKKDCFKKMLIFFFDNLPWASRCFQKHVKPLCKSTSECLLESIFQSVEAKHKRSSSRSIRRRRERTNSSLSLSVSSFRLFDYYAILEWLEFLGATAGALSSL